jgi:predicted membrane GTPase involved in stress response
MATQEQTYIKGFNYGYTLAKLEPETLKKLIPQGKPDNELLKGMIAGQKEYEKELAIEAMKQKLQGKSKSQDKDKGRGL